MHKPREMDLSMSAHSCLVLVTEATLQAAISEIGQTLQKKNLQAAPFFPQRVVLQNPRDCLDKVWVISTFSYIPIKAAKCKRTYKFVKECLFIHEYKCACAGCLW